MTKKIKKKKKNNDEVIVQVEDVDLADLSNERLEELQKQTDEITDLMRGNIIKIRDREGKIDDLVVRAEGLRASAELFETTTTKLRRMYFWKHRRVKIAIVGGIVTFVLIIASAVVLIVLAVTGEL